MILLIGGEKGGTAKSTTSVNLAVLRAKAGKKIILVDTDMQKSSSNWAATRAENDSLVKVECIEKTGKGLRQTLLDLAESYEDIIVDAGGQDSLEFRMAMTAADIVYSPIRTSQLDLETLPKVESILEEVQMINPDLIVKVVITSAPTNPLMPDIKNAQDFINEFELLQLAKSSTMYRVAYQRSIEEGKAVSEMDDEDKKATAEMEALYNEVFA